MNYLLIIMTFMNGTVAVNDLPFQNYESCIAAKATVADSYADDRWVNKAVKLSCVKNRDGNA